MSHKQMHRQTQLPKEQYDLLREIMQVGFVVVELQLYLDTHPNDRQALRLYNESAMCYHRLIMEYQRKYGMLMAHSPDGTEEWRWIGSPWPWEINYR